MSPFQSSLPPFSCLFGTFLFNCEKARQEIVSGVAVIGSCGPWGLSRMFTAENVKSEKAM